jgi:1-deoxy-D-xylulose-5-phosphate synthase
MWDLSILGVVPGIRVAAPRDASTLAEQLREALAITDGPTVLRFPKASVGEDVAAIARSGSVDVLRRPGAGEHPDVLMVTVGPFAELGLAAAERLADQGIGVTVVDPRWVFPVPDELADLAAEHQLVVTLEDSGRHGGFGWALAATLRDSEVDVPLRDLAVPNEFHPQGSRSEVFVRLGLTAQDVARMVTEWAADRIARPTPERQPAERKHP